MKTEAETGCSTQGSNCALFSLSIHHRAIMPFSHAHHGPAVCLAVSQLGVNASLVMSPRAAQEAPLSPHSGAEGSAL